MSLHKDFWQWFDEKRNGIPIREVERRGDAPHGRISNAYHRKKEPSAMVCETIAKGLGIDQIEVFTRAGLLPSESKPAQEEAKLIAAFRQLPPQKQQFLLESVRGLQGRPGEAPAIHESTAAYSIPAASTEPPNIETLAADIWPQLDQAGRQAVYDYARWRLTEQRQPRDSSGRRQALTDDEARKELIDFFQPFSPEERERLIMRLFEYLNLLEKIPRRGEQSSAGHSDDGPPAGLESVVPAAFF